MSAILKKIVRWFLNGMLVTFPVVVTAACVFWPLNWLSEHVYSFMDAVFRWLLNEEEMKETGHAVFILLKRFLSVENTHRIEVLSTLPYSSLFFAATGIVFLGILASNVLIQSGVKLLERVIMRIPGLNLLYSYAKEYIAAFVGKFDKPVMVTINRVLKIQKIGFITQEDVYNLRGGNKRIAVYVPHSYSFSGELLFFPKDAIEVLSVSSTEAWKIIISGGIASVPQEK